MPELPQLGARRWSQLDLERIARGEALPGPEPSRAARPADGPGALPLPAACRPAANLGAEVRNDARSEPDPGIDGRFRTRRDRSGKPSVLHSNRRPPPGGDVHEHSRDEQYLGPGEA